ncbi:MAG: RluA family pseudouridine synthase [Lentisphaerae bacterium]|nr:RluA family pseudouridine synthase [Lentisphaerota bacterium]
MQEWLADKEGAGNRLDLWVETRVPELSRARIQALVKRGLITVNGQSAKAHLKIRPGMTVRVVVPPPEPLALTPEAIPLDILFEDRDLIVLNKPAGLVVHPAAGHPSGTLVNALLHHCHDLAGINGTQRPGIVHRLDRDTTGVMVVAKHDHAMQALAEQFKAGVVHKQYVALVHGVPTPDTGTIESLIGRSRHDRKKMSATPSHGRRAVTHYEVAEVLGDLARLNLRIETGRTHQIRVHLTHIGHPVVGDATYGSRRATAGATRQMLHAASLSFYHPKSGKRLTFEAPLPADMVALLGTLRRAARKARPGK